MKDRQSGNAEVSRLPGRCRLEAANWWIENLIRVPTRSTSSLPVLYPRRIPCVCRIDEDFQTVGRPKIDHAAWRDGDFLAGFRIAPDALTLFPNRKTAERGDLDCFALGQGIGDLAQYGVDEFPTFVSG